MTVVVHPDIVASLGTIKADVVRHLAGVSRYRALRNIEQTMADIAEFQDLVTPLRDIREQIERQLQDTREYRALCTLDTIVPQLADVLAFLDEKSNNEEPLLNSAESTAAMPVPETSLALEIPDVYARAQETATAQEVADDITDAEPVVQSSAASPETDDAEHSAIQSERITEPSDIPLTVAQDDQVAPAIDGDPSDVDEHSEEAPSPPVATLAYNLANMLVQSLPPTTSEAKNALAADPYVDFVSPNADHAAQEGKAA